MTKLYMKSGFFLINIVCLLIIGCLASSAQINGILYLFSPEDKIYTSPMSGYYPASFGFENEPHATAGTDLEFLDEYHAPPIGAYVDIGVHDGPIYGHNKVLHIGDAQAGTYTNGTHYFDNPPTAGTIEFYLLVDNIHSPYTGTNYFHLQAMDDTIAVEMRINAIGQYLSNIEYFDGVSWQLISDHVSYKWYHHSISFDCEAGGGNGQFTWKITDENRTEVGRVENIDFQNDLNTLDKLYLASDNPTYFGATRWDAFGFSWDSNYNVGDNLREGLLLSYTTSVPLNWAGYSLDGGTNVTIIGNTTIPIPALGTHTIQVFGNDSGGTYYQSELRSFQISLEIPLLSPEDKSYTSPMSGYYPATYGFENEAVGTSGLDIAFVDMYDTSDITEVLILEELDGHKNVLKAKEAAGWEFVYNNVTDQMSGTVEFWARVDDATQDQVFVLRDEGNPCIELWVEFDLFHWRDKNDIIYDLKSCLDDTWYHWRIDFRADNTFDWYIDGVKEIDNQDMRKNLIDGIDQIYFKEYDPDAGWYLDAVGYSWDPNYNIGDNLEEGLLLSYFAPEPLKWTGYSLDGGTNVTIFGNTTIPMPVPGSHTIQVFGNVSTGDYYHSELRSFQIGNPPSTPLNLLATAGENYVMLSWSPPSDDGGSAITHYTVYRGTTSGSYSFLGVTSSNTFIDTSAIGGTTYYYVVTATNSVGESIYSNEASATPTAPTTTTTTTTTEKDGQVTSFPGVLMILLVFSTLLVFTRRNKRT